VRVVADTNVLLRAVLDDDPAQSRTARHVLSSSEEIIVGKHALCELVWVLSQTYKLPKDQIAQTVSALLNAKNVITDNAAAEAGLKTMKMGADFADGVIAHEGAMAGGEEFVSFDKKAVTAMTKQGVRAKLLK
jgi:predicted nucleic-acid-binding protein